MKNCYQILGLEPNCNADEIKSAFRDYAKYYHPDKHQGNEFFTNKFIEVKEAFDVLNDYHSRNVHDEFHKMNLFSKASSPQSVQNTSCSNTATNGEQTNSKNTQGDHIRNQTLTENHYYDWAEQKLNSNDYEGALELIGEGMKKFPTSGLMDFAEGQIQEAFGFHLRALKCYRKAFERGIVPAKDAMIKIQSLLDNAISVVKKHQMNGILFCIVGIIITFIGKATGSLMIGMLFGTAINFIGAILLSRRSFKELSRPLVDSLGNYSFETNLFAIILVACAMGSAGLTAFLIS